MNKINFKQLLEAAGNKLDLWHIIGLNEDAKNWAGAIAGKDAEKLAEKIKYSKSDKDAEELCLKIAGSWKNYDLTKHFLPTLKHLLVTNPHLKDDYENIKELVENYEYIISEIKDGKPSLHLIKFIKQIANSKNPIVNVNLPEKKIFGSTDSDDIKKDVKKVLPTENNPKNWFNIEPSGKIAKILADSGIKQVPLYSVWIKGNHPLSNNPILLYLALQDADGNTVKGEDLKQRVFTLLKHATKHLNNTPKTIVTLLKTSKIAGLPTPKEIDDWLTENKNIPTDLIRGWYNHSDDCFEEDDDCDSTFLRHLKKYASLLDSKEAKKKFYDNALNWTNEHQVRHYRNEFKKFINEALGQFEQPGGLSGLKDKFKSIKNRFSLNSGDREYVDKLVHLYNALVAKYDIGIPINKKDPLYDAVSKGDNAEVIKLVGRDPASLAFIRIAQSAAFPGTNRKGNQPIVGEREFKNLYNELKKKNINLEVKGVEQLALDIGQYIHGEQMQYLVTPEFKKDLETYLAAKSMRKQARFETKVNNMEYVGKAIASRIKFAEKDPTIAQSIIDRIIKTLGIQIKNNSQNTKLGKILQEIIDGLS